MATQGIPARAPIYVPYPNPTVNSWLGHFVDKESGGEVDLTVRRRAGDTVTFTLSDKGRAGEEHHNAILFPLSPLTLSEDVDLSNARSPVIETLVVKNKVELQEGVVLTLQKAEGGLNMGPDTKIQYARSSRLPGRTVTFELMPFMSPPR
jgi:hypothetical protein